VASINDTKGIIAYSDVYSDCPVCGVTIVEELDRIYLNRIYLNPSITLRYLSEVPIQQYGKELSRLVIIHEIAMPISNYIIFAH
jgi:hypothetical protein